MASEGNPGISKLASALSHRMKEESSSPLVLDFGSINADYSLQTNTFPVSIPKTDYTVCRQLTLGNAGSAWLTASGGEHSHSQGEHSGHENGNGSHSHQGGAHSHSLELPDKMRSLQPGDRVLVAWVQNDAVVIDLIMSASSI